MKHRHTFFFHCDNFVGELVFATIVSLVSSVKPNQLIALQRMTYKINKYTFVAFPSVFLQYLCKSLARIMSNIIDVVVDFVQYYNAFFIEELG